SDGVNGSRVTLIERERTTRDELGMMVVAILLQSERMHREYARIARHSRAPVRQHARRPIPQHALRTEPEIKSVRDHQRHDIERIVLQDRRVAASRELRVTVEPGTGGGGGSARRVA